MHESFGGDRLPAIVLAAPAAGLAVAPVYLWRDT